MGVGLAPAADRPGKWIVVVKWVDDDHRYDGDDDHHRYNDHDESMTTVDRSRKMDRCRQVGQ